jgi:hypothetical protein
MKMTKRLERLKNKIYGRITTYQSERKLVVSRRRGVFLSASNFLSDCCLA